MANFLDGLSEPAFGLWCSVADVVVAEALASTGADYIVIDTQHGASHEGNLVSMCQAVETGGSTPVVRVPNHSPAAIMKALDCGAKGVIVPLIESAEQAAAAASACRYPPDGSRSYGPFRASLKAGSSRQALEAVACIVMIETSLGVSNLDQIVSTPGIACAYFGPADLSLALGLDPGSFDAPEFEDVVGRLRSTCARTGIAAGAHCYDGAMAERYARDGFGMITVGIDMRLLRAKASTELAAARG